MSRPITLRNGAGQIVAVHSGRSIYGSAIGKPKEKIRIEPLEEPIPKEAPAPAPEVPVEAPEKVEA